MADARRDYARGTMCPDRVAQLERLGMVWFALRRRLGRRPRRSPRLGG
ncbi:hypothetical protein ACFYOV_32775 [Streptomyces sp. NPDC005931]